MFRTVFIHPLLLLSLLPASTQCARKTLPGDTRVILVCIDTLRKDRLAAFGGKRGPMPFLDRLAREGFSFRGAVAPSSWTKPSVASLMTGLYPGHHGTVGTLKFLTDLSSLDQGEVTLAERLKAAGYRTAAFITNPHIIRAYHFDQGFDEFYQPLGDAEELLKSALGWLMKNRKEGKFFLYLHLIDPHAPYFPPEPYRKRYARRDPGPRAPFTRLGFTTEITAWLSQYEKWRPSAPGERFRFEYTKIHPEKLDPEILEKLAAADPTITPENLASRLYLDFSGLEDPELRRREDHLIGLYDGEAAYTDEYLGGFLRVLKKQGILDRSLLVVTADHGEAFMEHGKWGHFNDVHGEEIRVPLLFRVPWDGGVLQGTWDGPVSLVDVYPTILDMLGLPPTPNRDGRSLWPLMRGPGASDRRDRTVFSELIRKDLDHVAAVSGRKMLIRAAGAEGPAAWFYYDLAADPGEHRPLDPEAAGPEAKRLMQRVSGLLKSRTLENKRSGRGGALSEEEIAELRRLGYL